MKKSDIIVIGVFSFLLILPILFTIPTTFPRLDTDYDSNLPLYQYMVNFLWQYHSFPLTIPFVTKGIPVLADPLNSFLNPLLSVPLLLFGINAGLRISLLLTVFLSGISMYILLKIIDLRNIVRLFGSLLYMSSGALIAQIASGHIEKFLVYPLVPLFLYFSLKRPFQLKESLVTSLIISLTVYSGDLYGTWFFLIFFVVIRLYFFIREKSPVYQVISSILVFPLVALLGGLKLYPFLTTVLPFMTRYFQINPYQGSVHALLLPLFFVIPFQVSFYDRPFFQHHLGFSFNWYEYYAFLSPIPFIFLLEVKKVWRSPIVQVLTSIIVLSAFYVGLGFFYSPFHWLFHIIGHIPFRVPQRIVLPLTSVVVLLICICANYWLVEKRTRRKLIITLFIASLTWTTIIFWQTLIITFPKKPLLQEKTINMLAQIDQQKDPVVTFAPEMQFYLVEKGIPILNYYYGWVPEGTQTYINSKNQYDFVKLLEEKPAYALTGPYISLVPYGYTNVLKNATIAIWKRN